MSKFLITLLAGIVLIWGCKSSSLETKTISPEVLKDKIAGGWAGKMIGVTYGAPTEFHALSQRFEDSIRWTPADIKGSLWQDDLYVQLTFMMSMDQYGLDAPAKKYQEMFARAGYPLWHANVQARKNYYDSIFPPESGLPINNIHADDIDFQIESDYIGLMCPGMPQQAVALAEKTGHIMNYGDGLLGGIFVAALYSAAFFESDIPMVIQTALKSLPSESDYYKIIEDVILLHRQFPSDWRKAWEELEQKYGDVDICGSGIAFNIDAKLNGAYIVMGLLYGGGDPEKTLEIATRCGQDSDCNPSNAMAVLGVIKGFSHLPESMQQGILNIQDSVFINTNYTFRKAVDKTYDYALAFIKKNKGVVSADKISIQSQLSTPAPLETSFPKLVFANKTSIFDNRSWNIKGMWHDFHNPVAAGEKVINQSRFASNKGCEISFSFEGTGISLQGNWVRDGGKADVYIDDKLIRTIDTYFYWNKQEHQDISIFHCFYLNPGKHTLCLKVKEDKRPESAGTAIYISEALVFKTAMKKNEHYRFPFQP